MLLLTTRGNISVLKLRRPYQELSKERAGWRARAYNGSIGTRGAVGMGIPMGIPMGMGVGWVWGLWWIPVGLLDLIWFVHVELWCSCITQYSTEYILWYYIQMAYMTKNNMIYVSNKNTQRVGYGYGWFRDCVDMGILWGFPQVFLCVWGGYGH